MIGFWAVILQTQCKKAAAKKILSSGEEESRNLDEYLDDSEAANKKVNKKNRQESAENMTARSKRWCQSIKNKETFLHGDDSGAENKKSKKSKKAGQKKKPKNLLKWSDSSICKLINEYEA